ncbi:MAG: hypothetical protein H6Q19_957 [Bacteroidetes bacterium]|nr:hypothetical protein [Bacteroidota bacterium]
MSLKKTVITFILLAGIQLAGAQIRPNETLVYNGSYQLSGMMTSLAQITMKTEPIKTSSKSYLRLCVQVATYTKWDSFFKIRDLYESYVHPYSLKPTLFKRNVYEGGYTKQEKYTFNAAGSQVSAYSKRRDKPAETENVNISANTFDAVTLMYKLRTVDLSKMAKGQSLRFSLIFDKKEHFIWIKMMGKETVSAGNLGKKECYKLSISAKTDKLRGVDKNLVWLSTDAKRIPCMMKFSIPVGIGQVTLSKATGI